MSSGTSPWCTWTRSPYLKAEWPRSRPTCGGDGGGQRQAKLLPPPSLPARRLRGREAARLAGRVARASVATAAPRLSADAGELPGTGTPAGSRGREPSPATLRTPGARGFPCSLSLGPAQTCRSEKLGVRWDGGRAGRVAVSDSQPGRGHSSAETRVAARRLPGALAGSPEHRPPAPWRVPLLVCARSPATGPCAGAPGARCGR